MIACHSSSYLFDGFQLQARDQGSNLLFIDVQFLDLSVIQSKMVLALVSIIHALGDHGIYRECLTHFDKDQGTLLRNDIDKHA